tara:strand:+ start:329 stop:589 length:261 start_codon:yes stop_codon:yes gene_type:complete
MTEKDKQIKEGQDAKMLLENPVLVGAFNQILNEGYQQWISTKPEDKEQRETLYHGQIAALKFKGVLVKTMENGQLLEQERKENKNG